MNIFLNIIWVVFGGLMIAIEYALSSVLMMLTIIGIPFGLQTLKLAAVALRHKCEQRRVAFGVPRGDYERDMVVRGGNPDSCHAPAVGITVLPDHNRHTFRGAALQTYAPRTVPLR